MYCEREFVDSNPMAGISPYLQTGTSNFKNVQLKFKLRCGISGLGEDLDRQNRGDGLCPHCNDFESLKHFILYCPLYAMVRQKLYHGIYNVYGSDMFNLFLQNDDFAILMLLGDHDNYFNELFLDYVGLAWTLQNNAS